MTSLLTTRPAPGQAEPTLVPVPERLVDRLRRQHQTHPDKPAFVERGQVVSCAEFWQQVDTVQTDFARHNIGPGEVVALCSPNSLALCVAFVGALQAGAVPFVINYKLDVLGDISTLNVRHFLVPRTNATTQRYFHEQPYFEHSTFNPQFDIYHNPFASTDALTDTVMLVTSSGSSGQAKVIRLTDHGTVANIEANIRALHLHPDDITAIGLPIGYAYGLVGQLLSHLYLGATVVLLDSLFFLPSLAQAISQYRITNFFVVPPMIRQLNYLRAQNQFRGNFSSLRFVAVGGNRIEASSVGKAITLFGCPIIKTYGLAEAGPRVATNPVTDPTATTADSVGRPNPGVQIDILGEAGELLPTGQPGIIRIQSPSVTLGYFNVADTGNIRPGRWVVTKDIGYMDAHGHLFILGRQGDQFTVGSRRHWFREVEAALYARFDFLRLSLRLTQGGGVTISAAAVRNYVVEPSRVIGHLREVFGPGADDLFTLEVVQTNTMLHEK